MNASLITILASVDRARVRLHLSLKPINPILMRFHRSVPSRLDCSLSLSLARPSIFEPLEHLTHPLKKTTETPALIIALFPRKAVEEADVGILEADTQIARLAGGSPESISVRGQVETVQSLFHRESPIECQL